MVCIWLEIGGFSVLKRLHPQEMATAISKIKQIFRYNRQVKSIEEGGSLIFAFDENEEFLHKLPNILSTIEKYFDSEKSFFQGNLLYLDIASTIDIRSNFERIQKLMLHSAQDKGINFSEAFRQKYSEPFAKLGFDLNVMEKSVYGQTITEKRAFLQNSILYARFIGKNVFTDDEILSLLEEPIFKQSVYQNINFDSFPIFKIPIEEIDFVKVRGKLGYQALDISTIFTQTLYKRLLVGVPNRLDDMARFFIDFGAGEMRLPAILYFAKLASLNYQDELSKEIESRFLSSPNIHENGTDLHLTEYLIRFYQALVCCDYDVVMQLQKQFIDLPAQASFHLELERKLALADCFSALRYPNESLKYAKEVLFLVDQNNNLSWFLLNANYLIAHAMLQKNKPFEAERYFFFTSERARSFQWSEMDLLSHLYLAFLSYLQGTLDVALSYFAEIDQLIQEKNIPSDYQVLYLFFKDRIQFELGNYEVAYREFSALEEISLAKGLSSWVEMTKRWQARSLIYLQRVDEGIEILEQLRTNPENHFFLAEGYYFQGADEKAYQALSIIDEHAFPLDHFISPYINLFKSAFINFEDRIIRYKEDQSSFKMQILFFKAYLAAKMGDRGLFDSLKPVLRGEIRSDGDPSSRLYCLFFAKTALFLDADDIHLDCLTSINRSFKFLNEYSGKIRNPEIRLDFLKNNIWNKEILQMAKQLQLLEK